MSKKTRSRLAIITTHPIQYYAPVFKLINERSKIDLKIFYTWGEDSIKPKYDPGFGKTIEWDIPLLEGYEYEFLKNTSSNPGSSHFQGIINPDAIQQVEAFKPDAVLIYGWSNNSHLKILRHFKGRIPVWFRGDSNLIDQQKGWKALLRGIFLRWVYSHVDKALYVGTANKEYFVKYGMKENQLRFVPHAIDNSRFSESRTAEVKTFRRDLNIPDNDILILFAGKLEPKKNPELLLQAYMDLKKEGVHLLFVGNGVLEESLKSEAKSKKTPYIHFLPFQNQKKMPVIYQSCDLFCLPSQGPGETWGLAVNEAMAAGKAIIVSNKVGCARDLVKDGENGFIFESGNMEHLLSCLKQICEDSEMLKDMGASSTKIIYNWSFLYQADSIEKSLNG